MKLIKLSLATLMALGTASYASDSLAEAFQNGKLKGSLQAHYTSEENGNNKDSITALGLKLNYKSGDFYGFNVNFGTQSSTTPWSNEDSDTFFAPANSEAVSGTVLSEASLEYKYSETKFKAGRQYITTMPLIKSSGSRLVMQSFEGYTVNSNDLEDTNIQAAYVTKFQNRTDGNGNAPEFNDLGGDYAYVVSAENKSLDNTKITLAYGEQDLAYSMAYLEAEYDNNYDSYRYGFGGQYTDVDYDESSAIDPNYYALRASIGRGIFDLDLAIADINDNDAPFSILGGGTKINMYTSAYILAGEHAESSQYSAQGSMTFKDMGLKVIAKYINIDYEAANEDADVFLARVHYKIPQVKNLMFLGAYESWDQSSSNKPDTDELWLRLYYSF